MATPHAAAVAAQIIDSYSASPDLIKALIIGSADGGGTTNAKDMNEVWGRLNAHSAIYKEADEYTDSYAPSSVGNWLSDRPTDLYYTIDVPSGAKYFIVTMVYSDDAGTPLLGGLLQNDLDLYFVSPSGTTYFYNDDSVNNVEKYRIQNPEDGTWEVHVKGIGFADWGGLVAKTVSFGITFRIIKQSQTSTFSVSLYNVPSTIKIGQTFNPYGYVLPNGYAVSDIWTKLEVPSGLTITNTKLDGTDGDKDVLGINPPVYPRSTKSWDVRADSYGTYTVYLRSYGLRRDLTNVEDVDSATVQVKRAEGQICSADSECYSGYCEGSSSYSARCCLSSPTNDGWYNYGDSGPGCSQMNDPTAEYRDYYCTSSGDASYQVTSTKDCDSSDGWLGGGNNQATCGVVDNDPGSVQYDYYVNSAGNCVMTTTNCGTQDCDSSDGWYGGGNSPTSCGDDPSASWRDYYVTLNTGSCTYTLSCTGSGTLDCDSQDVCYPYCSGNTAVSYKDYYVSGGGCTYALGSQQDCDISDGCSSGTYRNYYCSSGSCTYSTVITDNDFDGYDTQCDNDCNDNNASIHPGAPEICDGIDDNCDGSLGSNENIYSTGTEICGDGYDNDCDGLVDIDDTSCNQCYDNDADGFYGISPTCMLGDDCNDNDDSTHPPKGGMNITKSTNFCSGEYFINKTINIIANNVEVTCNATNIYYSYDYPGEIVVNITNRSNVVLRDCGIINVEGLSVNVVDSRDVSILNNWIGEYGSGSGISVSGSENINVIGNGGGVDGYCVYLSGGSNHKVINNSCGGWTPIMKSVDFNIYGTNITFSGNSARARGTSHTLNVDNSRIIGNTLGSDGVTIGGSNNTIQGNIFLNHYGSVISFSGYYNNITGNSVYMDDNYGYPGSIVELSGNNNLLVDNSLSDITDGLVVSGSYNNVSMNRIYGWYDPDYGTGCLAVTGSWNNFIDNSLNDCEHYAVELSSAHNNKILHTTIGTMTEGGIGLGMYSSDNNTVAFNKIWFNRKYLVSFK